MSISSDEALGMIGKALNIGKSTARKLASQQQWRRSPTRYHGSLSEQPSKIRTVNDQVEAQRESARRKADIAELKELTSKRAVITEWTEAIKTSALSMPTPALFQILPDTKGEEETALLLISDVHVGQDTPARLTAGFDIDTSVTHIQFKLLAQKIIIFWNIHNIGNRPWKKLVILDLGDDVEGSSMRASQARIANPLVTDQTRLYGQWLAEFITTLLQVFERIEVHRVPGNHGRVSHKAGIAGLDELDPANSFDLLAGKFTEAIVQPSITAGRVQITNYDGYVGQIKVAGQKVLFEHGSSLRGGASLGIPAYGIYRAAANFMRLYGEFDLLCMGHWHQAMLLPAGYRAKIVMNGAFPPTTPFVAGDLHNLSRPTQMLLSLHRHIGLTGIYPIYLDIPRKKT